MTWAASSHVRFGLSTTSSDGSLKRDNKTRVTKIKIKKLNPNY